MERMNKAPLGSNSGWDDITDKMNTIPEPPIDLNWADEEWDEWRRIHTMNENIKAANKHEEELEQLEKKNDSEFFEGDDRDLLEEPREDDKESQNMFKTEQTDTYGYSEQPGNGEKNVYSPESDPSNGGGSGETN